MPDVDDDPTQHKDYFEEDREQWQESARQWRHERGEYKSKANGSGSHPKALPFRLPGEMTAEPKPWLIKDAIASGETSTIIGAPGAAKSALALDLAVSLQGYGTWRGKAVKSRCAVAYFALERAALCERRIAAYKLRGDLSDDMPLAIVNGIVDLINPRGIDIVLDTVAAIEDRCTLPVEYIVFDTYSKAIAAGGGDENLARDQNKCCANLRLIHSKVAAHIACVGHTGKDPSRGERGSNAKLADVDAEITVTATDLGIRNAVITKANDQDGGPFTSFALERVELGVDDDGEPYATYIVDRQLNPETASSSPGPRLSPRQQVAFDALIEVVNRKGRPPPVDFPATKVGFVVSRQDWLEELLHRAIIPAQGTNPHARFSEVATGLSGKGYVGVRGELVWIIAR